MTSPAEPSVVRRAATVVVTRPSLDGPEPEIYMVRRSAKSPFMPSTLVFPGGRLDPADGPPEDDGSWIRAACRECQEETGIELADSLQWFDTWLTPSAESRRRYLTRFFLAAVTREQGDLAEADGHETHDGRWATARGHLDRWEAEEADLPPPTLCTLLRLADLGADASAGLAEFDPAPTILPKVSLTPQGLRIVMPHDPEYDALEGEALAAPARTRPLPSRFFRNERVWRPVPPPSTDASA